MSYVQVWRCECGELMFDEMGSHLCPIMDREPKEEVLTLFPLDLITPLVEAAVEASIALGDAATCRKSEAWGPRADRARLAKQPLDAALAALPELKAQDS